MFNDNLELNVFLNLMSRLRNACHQNSKDKGFWDEQERPCTYSNSDGSESTRMIQFKPWNFGEKVALIHSELSEMFEAWRKSIKESDKDIEIVDSKLDTPVATGIRRITAIEEEMADTFIRLFDLCGKLNIDVGRVILAKMEYNATRKHMHGGRKC